MAAGRLVYKWSTRTETTSPLEPKIQCSQKCAEAAQNCATATSGSCKSEAISAKGKVQKTCNCRETPNLSPHHKLKKKKKLRTLEKTPQPAQEIYTIIAHSTNPQNCQPESVSTRTLSISRLIVGAVCPPLLRNLYSTNILGDCPEFLSPHLQPESLSVKATHI
jgi:hypothetical protein